MTFAGGYPNADQRQGDCVDLLLTRGREGVNNPKNLADIICMPPREGEREGLCESLRRTRGRGSGRSSGSSS